MEHGCDVSAGGAMYKFRQPGVYVYLSHNLIEAVNLGVLAQIKVEGQWNDEIMKQVMKPSPMPDDGSAPAAAGASGAASGTAPAAASGHDHGAASAAPASGASK